jgi:hypothetical protein
MEHKLFWLSYQNIFLIFSRSWSKHLSHFLLTWYQSILKLTLLPWLNQMLYQTLHPVPPQLNLIPEMT